MKHGRRHDKLKEQVYAERFRQRAPGYATPHRPLPLAADEGPPEPVERPHDLPEATPPTLGQTLNARKRKQLARLGIEPDEGTSQ